MIMEWISFIRYFLSTTTSIQENHSSCSLYSSKIIHLAAYTLRKSLQTTLALSTTSKQCFEQPAASYLVCSLIFIEFHSTVTYGQMLILLFFYAISNFNWPALTPILSMLPATKSPLRRSSANLSSTSVCRVLRSGRAPISGSYP
ncbi:S1 RNA-binding domain-containing protein [Streptococcus pneumoniae]|nr:S1 RNA-binding domain-containing protein [Streptococcus pneumoniae]CWA79275.1 S1 RNA-binding domain-containing protein [Streptococcus pneumoniae]VJN48342.1 S1 RNA-binding domain-containing protein [Streptococcus pneumoniae]VLB72930.1 S1 RNA-binding domain-containing protein [Streptococcus pneumoniae]VOW19264.1 S1 RNA-binding domain-containing protein [Streptococcus pneumoniae]